MTATGAGTGDEVLRTVVSAHQRGIDVTPFHAMYEELLCRLPLGYVEPTRVVASLNRAGRFDSASWLLKRGIDLAAGCVGCALLAPLPPLLALGVRLDVGRPVFFRQERLGRAGRPFRYYIKHQSLWLDAEIAWRTLWTVATLSGR